MARSLEEIELAFQAQYPKVEKKSKSKKVSPSKQEKAIQKEAIQEETIREETIQEETKQETAPNESTQNEATTKSDIQAEELPSDTASMSILGILFYLVLALMVVGTIIFSKEALGNRAIGGYHFYEVKTTAMQSAYPKGSMVFVRDIDINVLMVGYDVTFQNEDNEVIISRIIEIKEELDENNNKVFVTLGSDEVAENIELISANQVTGKVTGSIPFAGMIFNWIGNNLWAGFAALGVLVITFVCTKLFKKKDKVAKKD